MSCKFKSHNEKCTSPYCKVTYGECQFTKDDHDDVCSIRAAYLGDSASSDAGSAELKNTEDNATLKSKFKKLFRN